jgi:hypothetical protein
LRHRRCRDGPPGRIDRGRVFRFGGCAFGREVRFDWLACGWVDGEGGESGCPGLRLTTADYLQILDWTGRTLAPGKRERIADDAPAVLSVIDRDAERWALRVGGFGNGWVRVAGSAQDLMALAERIGQRWLKGIGLALQLG